MVAYGPNATGTVASDATVGAIAWANPANATADDSSYAAAPINDAACFVAGTLVNTPGGLRRIESLEAGDLVWADHSHRLATVTRNIVQQSDHRRRMLFRSVVTDDSVEIEATLEHPFRMGDNFRAVGELRIDDVVSGFRLVAASEIHCRATVYNLSVTSPNTYLVHGIEVHNK